MGQAPVLKREALTIASLSIFLYGLTGCISYFYFRKFSKLENSHRNQAQLLIGKYDHAKRLFFGILMVSSFLEIPGYIGCLATDGPTDCEWHSPSQVVFWFFHLLALCGYAYCIVIPCILWSDMINKQDGRLFFSSYPYDGVKRYFQVLLILYFLNSVIGIIVAIAYYKLSDRVAYQDAPTSSIGAVTETFLIVLISVGCLFCGIQLQVYVHNAKLNLVAEMKFLFTLNVILFVIVLSFLGRAILVLRLGPWSQDSFEDPVNYPTYTIIARWTPDIFCQFLLIYIMRLSGNEVLTKNSTVLGTVPVSHNKSGFFYPNSNGKMTPLLASDEYEPDSDELRTSFQESMLPVLKMAENYNNPRESNNRTDDVENNILLRFSKSIETQADGFSSIEQTLVQSTTPNASDPIPIPRQITSPQDSSSNYSRRFSNSAYLQSYDGENNFYSPPQSYIQSNHGVSPLMDKYQLKDEDNEL
jgi:hypothetical protein